MRGSKYIQSKLGNVFVQVKKDLETDLLVLFTGTSCQIAGLRSFLNDQYNSLICVDIVCLGTPSPRIWQQYLQWQQETNKQSIVSVDFRNKRDYGWKAHVESLYLKNGQAINSEVFKNLFLGRYILRPSCYECPFKSLKHPGDITIADYWGIEHAAPGFDDNKGVSLVLINTLKGGELFDSVKNDLLYVKTRIEDSLQPALISPFSCPANREKFWNELESKGFTYIAKKYAGHGIVNQIKQIVRGKMKGLLRRVKGK